MADMETMQSRFQQAHELLKDNMVESFEHIQNNPQEKDETLKLWKSYIRGFVKEGTELSEQYHNKDIVKAISKMLIFGR